MSRRTDPLVALFGAAVAAIVLLAVALVFYPRVSEWLRGMGDPVFAPRIEAEAKVAVWVSRDVPGAALLLQPLRTAPEDPALDRALRGGPYRYLELEVYNFAGPDPLVLDLGEFRPEKGAPVVPDAGAVEADTPGHLRSVLAALGAVSRLEVPAGRRGRALLLASKDAPPSGGLSGAGLSFVPREVGVSRLASWQREPKLEEFADF